MVCACSGDMHRMVNICESDESPSGDWNHISSMFPLGATATSDPFTGIIGRVVVSVMVSFRLVYPQSSRLSRGCQVGERSHFIFRTRSAVGRLPQVKGVP